MIKRLIIRELNRRIIQYVGFRISEVIDDKKDEVIDHLILRVKAGTGYGDIPYEEWAPPFLISTTCRFIRSVPAIVEGNFRWLLGWVKVDKDGCCPWCGDEHHHEIAAESIDIEDSGVESNDGEMISRGSGVVTCSNCLAKFDCSW